MLLLMMTNRKIRGSGRAGGGGRHVRVHFSKACHSITADRWCRRDTTAATPLQRCPGDEDDDDDDDDMSSSTAADPYQQF